MRDKERKAAGTDKSNQLQCLSGFCRYEGVTKFFQLCWSDLIFLLLCRSDDWYAGHPGGPANRRGQGQDAGRREQRAVQGNGQPLA